MEAKMKGRTVKLVTGGVLIALGTVLSVIKVFEMPYGGSITFCSMLPVMLFSYKYGIKWGVFSGLIYGVLQFLLGTGAIKGLTLGAVIGVVVFDFLVAFGVLGFAGVFRKKIKNNALGFSLGVLVAAFLRYLSHIISGYIFFGDYAEWYFTQEGFALGEWSMQNFNGSSLALWYSAVYNGTYMLPEIVITTVVAFALIKLAGKQLLSDRSL